MLEKRKIRDRIKKLRLNLIKEQVLEESEFIYKQIIDSKILERAEVIMSYMSFQNEIDTEKINEYIISCGKKLLLPKMLDREIIKAIEYTGEFKIDNSFGIKEPVGEIYNGDIDLIIVPGVVFDIEGNRIGYGRGYYDRFLKLYPRVRKISLAYEFQILDRLEVEEHDEKIDVIVTKNNIRRIKKYWKISDDMVKFYIIKKK